MVKIWRMSCSAKPALLDNVPNFDLPVALRGFGGRYVGGRIAHVEAEARAFATPDGETRSWPQSGHFAAGQLYAQIFLPADARSDCKIQFWHGGGLTGAQWEQTPDDRPGWLQYALEDGFDAIVCDAAERGRAGIPHSKIVNEAPVFRSNEQAWHGFRIGPEGGYNPDPTIARAYDRQKFPTDAFHTFCRQFTARWPGFTDTIQSAYDALLSEAGQGNIIIAHSEGARYALEAARRAPDAVTALILVEPAGAPSLPDQQDVSGLTQVPVLSVWGDFLNASARWQCFVEQFENYTRTVGLSRHDRIDLNTRCSPGHSHFPMLDHGNDAVWRLISDWISCLETRAAGAANKNQTFTVADRREEPSDT